MTALDKTDEDYDLIDALGGTDHFGDRLSIYIPNKDRDNRQIDQNLWIDKAIDILSEIGGGCTVMPPVTGVWRLQTGALIREEPVLIYAFVIPQLLLDKINTLRSFLHSMGRETNQDAVGLEYNGQFFTIETYDEA